MSNRLQTSASIRHTVSAHPAITSTEVGLINGHLQRGDHDQARKILAVADKRQEERETAPLPRDLTKVNEELNALRITLRALERRLAKLEPNYLSLLQRAAELDWASVEPVIFGTLFERSLDPQKRSQLAAHYISKGNLEPVLAALRDRCGYTRHLDNRRVAIDLCVWGDNDASGGGQEAAHLAALKYDAYVRLPAERGDFNDLHQNRWACGPSGALPRSPRILKSPSAKSLPSRPSAPPRSYRPSTCPNRARR